MLMNRLLLTALLVVNLAVLGTALRAMAERPVAAPYQAVPLTVTASSFTYQGRLQRNGQPVTAACDLTFGLFDAPGGGNRLASQDLKAVAVTDGLFTAALDFGADAFNGPPRW